MGKKKSKPKVEKDKLKEAIKNEKKSIEAKPEDKTEGVAPHILQMENQQSKAKEKVKQEKETVEKPEEAKGEVKTEKKVEKKRKIPIPSNFTEENVLAKMKELGGKDITSTMIKNAFGLSNESGRGTTRRMMKKLEKNKKVKIHLKEGKRRQYLYDVANPGHIVYDPTKERTLKRK